MRVAASVAGAALVASALAGCMFVTPQQTARSYTPSDGVNGRVGQVDIRNVLLITTPGAADTGTSAELVGALANRSDSAETVTMQYDSSTGSGSAQVEVPAHGLVSLRPGGATAEDGQDTGTVQQVSLEGITAPRGGLFTVGFASGAAQPVDLRLPVLTNSLREYSTLTPTPTPTPTPTRTRRVPQPSDSQSVDAITPTPTTTESPSGR